MSSIRGGHLSTQLQEAGIDMDLINQVLKLKEIEALVKDGKVKQETYESLVDDVLKGRIQQEKASNAGNKQDKARSQNMLGKLRGIISSSSNKKTKNSKATAAPESSGGAVRQKSTPAPQKKFAEVEEHKEVLHDELLRLGMDKAGNPVWRKVQVTLYDDSLEYFVPGKRGEVKNKKVIHLSDEFFVNSEVNRQQLMQAHMGAIESDESNEVFGQPHLFLLSDVHERFYFAAEDEVKKEFWITMLVQTIRDLTNRRQSVMYGRQAPAGKSRNFATRYETMKKKYYTDQMRKTMRFGKIEDFQEENFAKEEAKWIRRGERLARQSVAVDWKKQELEQAQEALKQQEILKEQLRQKEEALEQVQQEMQENNQQWQKKYDDLLAQMREEAQARNEERRAEQARLEEKIREMGDRVRSSSFMDMGDDERFKEFQQQLEIYKTKLKALESALNVDMSNLDWDGTLEDAEQKMQALVKDLMSPDETVQREAQAQFDQWDNIIRNHADFKDREVKKWKDWEEENYSKNIAALNEMKDKFVPRGYLSGISMKELISQTGISNKAAKRIMQNRIFKFFWMDKDSIAKIHVADLLNNYASQGLDIRELRAVYASLPDEFIMDNDGRKKQFRDQLRNRLFELTNKEKNNGLNSQEKLNNAYRDKNVNDKPKMGAPGGPKKAAPKKKNGALAAKAMALQGLLEGRGGPPSGPPASQPKAAPAMPARIPSQKKELNPNDAEWKGYFMMKKNGLPDGAIMNKMQKDMKDPNLWYKLVELSEKSQKTETKRDTQGQSSVFDSSSSFKTIDPVSPPQSSKKVPATMLMEVGGDDLDEIIPETEKTHLPRKSATTKTGRKPKTPKRKQNKRGTLQTGDGTQGGPRRQSKKTLRKSKTGKKRSSFNHMVLAGDAGDLVSKATLDYASHSMRGGAVASKNLANLDNYANTKSQQRAAKMTNAVDNGVQELVEIITQEGVFDVAEGGVKTMKFGELFTRYESISDMLVGLLLKAKRQGLIKYRGDMLFKGIHDEIKITVQ